MKRLIPGLCVGTLLTTAFVGFVGGKKWPGEHVQQVRGATPRPTQLGTTHKSPFKYVQGTALPQPVNWGAQPAQPQSNPPPARPPQPAQPIQVPTPPKPPPAPLYQSVPVPLGGLFGSALGAGVLGMKPVAGQMGASPRAAADRAPGELGERELLRNSVQPGAQRTAQAPSTQPPQDQRPRGVDPKVTKLLQEWGPAPAPLVDPRRFTEAHWQGLEVIPRTRLVAQALKLPPDVPGVIVDDVTLPADLQGFKGGDLVTHVGQVPTPDLVSFIRASNRVRDRRRVQVDVLRDGRSEPMVLAALLTRLGTANGETPSMIPPGARMPHPFRGPCTNCHRIGTTGTIPVDQGDLITPTAPTIRVGDRRPHEDRGPCSACHQILP